MIKRCLSASFYFAKNLECITSPRNIFERYKNKERSAAMALSDLEILARLIQCEAGGEGENGMQLLQVSL